MSGRHPVRTYIVEDNATIRENLIATLEELGGVASIGYAETEQQGSDWLTGQDAPWELGVDAVFDKSTDIDALIAYCLKLRGNAGH